MNSQCKTNWMSHNVEKITRLILRMHCQLAQSSVFIQKLIYWYNYWTLEFYVRSFCSWNFIKFRLIACVCLCVPESAWECLCVPVHAEFSLKSIWSSKNYYQIKIIAKRESGMEWAYLSRYLPWFKQTANVYTTTIISEEKNARLGFYLKIIACEIFKIKTN